MATLVLTVAGGAIGGPIGAAIGATLGNAIDRNVLFAAKNRQGPRLSDLAVQTSSYGTMLPKLFGTIRVAGCVIWATDLVEHSGTQSNGKGQPKTTSYSYTASFAVALSARPIRAVHRIWADGNLLRGAAGDFKTSTGFRLYLGDEAQAPDPLIAAAEGAALAPAHRGLAYAVFEDLALGDFGNRIPSLTFEVEADAAPGDIGAIAAELSGGTVAADGALLALDGLSAYGDSVRAVLEPLVEAAGAWCVPDGGNLLLRAGSGAAVRLEDAGAGDGARRARSIAAAESVARSISLSYYDAARDYQSGLQRAVRPGAGSRSEAVALPAVLPAGTAKAVAQDMLARAERARERRTVTLDWRALALRPGDRVTIAGTPGVWRIDRWSLEGMALTLECVAVGAMPAVASASSGRVASAPDRTIGPTRLVAAELPPLSDELPRVPRLSVLAAGTGAGWRRAALLVSTDAGAQWSEAGGTAAPAVLGTVMVPPGAAPVALIDRRCSVEVELLHDAMQLADADAAALDAGGNLALVGGELLQFGRAEALGDRRWRLGALWRGRRGTEAAIGSQAAGDGFALLTAASVATIDLPLAALGGEARLLGSGTGDGDVPAEARAPLSGASLLPPSPVHLTARVTADGSLALAWIRRSRAGWRWIDAVDAPLAEEDERYRVALVRADAATAFDTAVPALVLGADEWAGATSVEVRQRGDFGLSLPATCRLP